MCLSTEGGLQKQTDKKEIKKIQYTYQTDTLLYIYTLTTSSNKRGGFSMKQVLYHLLRHASQSLLHLQSQ